VSSPATHYATGCHRSSTPCNDAKTLQFFAPGGNSEKDLPEAATFFQCLASRTTTPSALENIEIIENNKIDDKVEGHQGNFLGSELNEEPKLGHNATGQSPSMALERPTLPTFAVSSPPKQSPALCPSSFATILINPLPSMDGTVNVDPNFFKGTDQVGSSPGPNIKTMSVIKDKTKIHEQLISALSKTVMILTKNLPNAHIHCIKKSARLPTLSSASCSLLITTVMQANNYMYIQNTQSLTPGVHNNPKMPIPKVGKDGCPVFDENRGYEGPNCITTIMWITADCNIKDALTDLQMELEGEHLQIRWKLAQKKNSRNQIVIYGVPPGFDLKGIMHELLFGLKESEKELCNHKHFSPSENMDHRDRVLPLFNGYYKQSTPPKTISHSKSLENSLNKNKEFLQNGCKLFQLKYDPAENVRMDPVWIQFIASGQSKLVLDLRSKVFVLPNPGQQDPHQIMLIRQYMRFHCCYTGCTCIHLHPIDTNLDKSIKISMMDGSCPPRKFTTLRQEYLDLHTIKDLPVFRTIILRVETPSCGPSIDCLYLSGNTMAKDLSTKIAVCPLAWWWRLFQLRGYIECTAKSLNECFEANCSAVAHMSTFDQSMGTVTTQFANTDEFRDMVENELGSDDDAISVDRSEGGTPRPPLTIKISKNAKTSFALALDNPDMDLAANVHTNADSRPTNFLSSTGNYTN
jgi:hypothetical protein